MQKLLTVKIFVILLFCQVLVYGQQKSIKGSIKDEYAKPLQGATITVLSSDGESLLTEQSRADGGFSITLPEAARSLSVSFLGYETQHVLLSGRNTYDVILPLHNRQLEDIIVVGYGTARRADLTGAIDRISHEDLVRENSANILQAMQGKLAGVAVTQNDGAPGAGISIRIRGSNSFLGGTEPLYVIDGIPYNANNSDATPVSLGEDEHQSVSALAFLDPNDIESIDILKDASATAIYGSRGANGVVLITTRKGQLGMDNIEASANFGVSNITKVLDVLTAAEYAEYQNISLLNANKYEGTSYNIRYPDLSVFANENNNWQKQLFRQGRYHKHALSIAGATNAGNHRLGFNYLQQEGVISNSNYEKYGLSLNLNRNVKKYLKIGTSASVSRSVNNGVKTGTDKSDAASAGVIRSAISFPPTITTIEEFTSVGDSYFITNPVIYTNDVLNKISTLSVFNSNYVEISILDGLKFRNNLGFNYYISNRDQYYPRTVYEGFGSKGWGLKADNSFNSVISESILTYEKRVEQHLFNLTGAGTYERTQSEWKRSEAKTFPNDLLQNDNMQAAEQIMPIRGARTTSNLVSFIARLNYSFMERYLLTVSYRQDGSSKFGANNKWAGFPSAAISWKINQEDFLKNVEKINNLGLRLSYGKTGNQGIGAYSSLSKLAVYNYPFDGSLQSGLADDFYAGPANPNIKWETTDAYNAGLDVSLFNSRLNVTTDFYLKRTNDLLQFITTPASTGFTRQLVNSGSVENKGIEVRIDGQVVANKDWKWNTGFNFSLNRNKILSLGNGLTEQFAANISTNDAPFIQTVGAPIGAIYGYVEDGYYDNEAEVRNSMLYYNQDQSIINRMVGEIKYKNLDDDPTSISTSDRMIIGDVNPKYSFGITNQIQYKDFDLSIFLHAVQGNDIINMNTRFIANLGTQKNITQAMFDGAWSDDRDNTHATGPKMSRQFWRTLMFSRRFVEDGSFVRLKNITLGYTLPNSIIKGISNAKVSLGVNNLFTWTNYSGYDPEINSYGDNPALFGVDLGGYPNARTYNLTLQCKF